MNQKPSECLKKTILIKPDYPTVELTQINFKNEEPQIILKNPKSRNQKNRFTIEEKNKKTETIKNKVIQFNSVNDLKRKVQGLLGYPHQCA
jgi:hypothetical protein